MQSRKVHIPASVKRLSLIVIVLVALVAGLLLTASFWVNWLWYGSIGYRDSLITRYRSELVYTLLGGVLTSLFFALNLLLAMRRSRAQARQGVASRVAGQALLVLIVGGSIAVGIIFGSIVGSRWEMWQLARFVPDYGTRDPVFDRDIGFYLLRLPALSTLLDLLLVLVLITGAATTVVYVIRLGIRWAELGQSPKEARVHVLAIGGVAVILMGLRYLLNNYQLVYSTRGAAFGAGFTDVNVQRWANYGLLVISVAVGGLLLVNAFMTRVRPLLAAIALWAIVSVLLGILIPPVIQSVFVEPSEFRRERPYIANNIEMTREGFGLSQVDEQELTADTSLEREEIEAHPETVDNIRLWDYRIARTTYQQLQSFVPYYLFLDVDVDRYETGESVQQVLLSARELDIEGLPEGARTWTNTHLVYTHGYGAVVSPVSQATEQGLPVFLVDGIPPTGDEPYVIDRPEIYFGENAMDWVAVRSNQPEFSGEISFEPGADTGYEYEGEARGSVSVGNFLGRLLIALHLRDQNVFYTDQFTDETRILLKQQITERVSEVAPFLTLDPDPYLVISEGRLYWIIDGYTSSNRFPHATRFGGINYMRNSVKVTVDTYNGTITLYRTAEHDPIIDAYDRTYGEILQPVSSAPPDLAAHFRYPELLFDIQSEAFTDFHVTDPTAFYNGEDRWAIPPEQMSIGAPEDRMEPYYVTMTLPGGTSPDFALIRPFIPGGRTERQNMTAWMAGVGDASGANRLVTYRFPRQTTIFGPSQISARIDQEPDISSQISLWNQSGSEVLRGNLLVIPVRESVPYVQPLYLQARGAAGSLPEMRRVIAASSERVVMRETLQEALDALTASAELDAVPEDLVDAPDDGQPEAGDSTAITAAAALEAYRRGQVALEAGDWAAYGEAQSDLEQILTGMAGAAVSEIATPLAGTPEADDGS